MGEKSKERSQGDRLLEATGRKWVLLSVRGARNPNRSDGKFKVRRWGFSASQRFGPRLVSIVQSLFKRVGDLNLDKLAADMDGGRLLLFQQLEALNIDWGDLMSEHVDYIHDIICNALMPNFKDLSETQEWVEDNIDFFARGNALALVQDIVLLQFGMEEKSGNVERLPEADGE